MTTQAERFYNEHEGEDGPGWDEEMGAKLDSIAGEPIMETDNFRTAPSEARTFFTWTFYDGSSIWSDEEGRWGVY